MSQLPKFIGLDTEYPTADGQLLQRIHLDGAASPLAAQTALDTVQKILPHYSNTHSYVHASAQICTQALAWAHQRILSILKADNEDFTAIFIGSGTTSGINRVVRGLSELRPDKKVVLVSAMEHHANDLPHRRSGIQIETIPLSGTSDDLGTIDINALEVLLLKHQGQVNYIAFSAVSNVTGIINPVDEITELAHRYGALVLVDAAQMVAHLPVALSKDDKLAEPDFFVFSGHKVYTPGSPGVLIAKKSLLDRMAGQDLGGGSVSYVDFYGYELLENYPDREQSGTPNIVGAISLAAVMSELDAYGYDKIQQHGSELVNYCIAKLSKIDDIQIYGDLNSARIGAVAFNHIAIDHGLLAAILSDYFCIAVRNECFCAHPYVSSLIKENLWEVDLTGIDEELQESYINRKRGMVRVSFSLYNNFKNIDYLFDSIVNISENIESYRTKYHALDDGSYRHESFQISWQNHFKPL